MQKTKVAKKSLQQPDLKRTGEKPVKVAMRTIHIRPPALLETRLASLLRRATGSTFAVVEEVYRALCAAPEEARPRLLRFCAERFHNTPGSAESTKIVCETKVTAEVLERLFKKYYETARSMVSSLIADNPPEADFYKRLWSITTNSFFVEEEAKVYVLFTILLDKRIPYFQITESGLLMSNDEYLDRLNSIRPKAQRLQYLYYTTVFSQRSEQADLIARQIFNADEVDRAVLVAWLINEAQQNAKTS